MVELETMYPGIAFSPQTKLTAAINESDTVISVESTAGLPDGPNYATIGTDENAETIYYAIKLPTQLSGCVRGVEGLAKAWTIGDVLGRNFTAKDYEAILNNLLALKTSADSLSADVAAHGESLTELEADLSAAESAVAAGKTYTLTHSKSGTVHTLAGVPELQGVFAAQFRAMADFAEGDTFAGYVAKPNGEETVLPDKVFISGDIVSVVVDTVNKKLGFKIGGGGGELNFTVVGGTEAPTAPKENTIWVNTDQEITEWMFRAEEPESPVEGMVWFTTAASSAVAFNALAKTNTLMVYPVRCYHYISGAWEMKVASIYQAGAWVTMANKGLLLSALPDETIVKINEDGVPIDYVLMKHNYEDALNGKGRTLFMRTTSPGAIMWRASTVSSAYVGSNMEATLDAHVSKFDAEVQKNIRNTKFYATPVYNGGVKTVSYPVFILSARELVTSGTSNWNSEGTNIPVAKNHVISSRIHTRTIRTNNGTDIMSYSGGGLTAITCEQTADYQPCITLPESMMVNVEQNTDGSYTLLA